MAGWIAEMLFMLFVAYIAMQRTELYTVAEYKAHWLASVPIINH